MKKDNSLFLNHILQAIEDIEDYIKDTSSQEDFTTDKKTHNAVLRSFQVIGEAANNLDEDFLNIQTDIEWEKVIGMRNFIIHEYFGVDLKLTYKIAKENIPELKKNILKILKEEFN